MSNHGEHNGKGQLICASLPRSKQHYVYICGHSRGINAGRDYERIAQSMTQGFGFFLPGFKSAPEKGLRLIVDRQLSQSVLGRSAYCERMLGKEARLGCRQIVIFASGYDTFAIRSGKASLPVYEMDLPEVLVDKKQRLENAGLTSRAIYDGGCKN